MTKIIFLLFLSTFSCIEISAQRELTEIDLTVNGIRSGSPASQLKKFGKPIKVKIIGFDECAGQYRRVLYFKGLEVGLLGSKNGKRSNVMSLVVTSPKLTITPNVRIGTTRESLKRKFGIPVSETETRIDYVTKDNMGLVTFRLRKGKLIRVEMMETLC